jgi:hypothetical protein
MFAVDYKRTQACIIEGIIRIIATSPLMLFRTTSFHFIRVTMDYYYSVLRATTTDLTFYPLSAMHRRSMAVKAIQSSPHGILTMDSDDDNIQPAGIGRFPNHLIHNPHQRIDSPPPTTDELHEQEQELIIDEQSLKLWLSAREGAGT